MAEWFTADVLPVIQNTSRKMSIAGLCTADE